MASTLLPTWLSRVEMASCRIRLLFSLSAALPFSEDGHPVYNWRASVSCGHFLGVLFRYLAEGQEVVHLPPVAGPLMGHATEEDQEDQATAGEERENSETKNHSENVPSQSSTALHPEAIGISDHDHQNALGARKKGKFQ